MSPKNHNSGPLTYGTTQEIKVLKDKLVDSGPEVVKKISEERDKAESRLRSAHRNVSELEAALVEMQGQLERATGDNIKVTEEHRVWTPNTCVFLFPVSA